jgi:hypothetical protein
MNITNSSWKTTSAGILAIIGGLTTIAFALKTDGPGLTPEIITTAATAILGGVGLMFARDNNKTSEEVGAPKAEGNTERFKKTSNEVKVLGLLFGFVLFSGCASIESSAYKTLAITAASVDKATQAYGDYVRATLVMIDAGPVAERPARLTALRVQRSKAAEVYARYQAAMVIAEKAVKSAKSAPDGQADWQTALNTAGAAASEFIAFVRLYVK